MGTALAKTDHEVEIKEALMLRGDISVLTKAQRITYYQGLCERLGLDYRTRPFEYVKFKDVLFPPKPVQQPIPIWVGGESGPALRRTAAYGDAWYPIGTNPQFPLDTLDRYKAGVAKLRGLTEKAGRDPNAVGLAYRVSSNASAQPRGTVDGKRKLFTGDADDFVGDIKALADVGVTSFDVGLFGPTLDATIDNMRRFRDEVLAKAK